MLIDTTAIFERARHRQIEWSELRDQFRCVDIEAVMVSPEKSFDIASLGRLRGALGQRLKTEAPDLYRLFFTSVARLSPSLEVPKPFLLQADHGPGMGEITFRLRLFGPVMDAAPELAEHFAAALEQPAGRQPVAGASHMLTLHHKQFGCAPILTRDGRQAVCMMTPLTQRANNQTHLSPQATLKSLLRRINGICAWSGVQLAGDLAQVQAELIAHFPEAKWLPETAIATQWFRSSTRQGMRYRVDGFYGLFDLGDQVGPFEPLFDIGILTHLAGKATHGMGRFRLISHGTRELHP